MRNAQPGHNVTARFINSMRRPFVPEPRCRRTRRGCAVLDSARPRDSLAVRTMAPGACGPGTTPIKDCMDCWIIGRPNSRQGGQESSSHLRCHFDGRAVVRSTDHTDTTQRHSALRSSRGSGHSTHRIKRLTHCSPPLYPRSLVPSVTSSSPTHRTHLPRMPRGSDYPLRIPSACCSGPPSSACSLSAVQPSPGRAGASPSAPATTPVAPVAYCRAAWTCTHSCTRSTAHRTMHHCIIRRPVLASH